MVIDKNTTREKSLLEQYKELALGEIVNMKHFLKMSNAHTRMLAERNMSHALHIDKPIVKTLGILRVVTYDNEVYGETDGVIFRADDFEGQEDYKEELLTNFIRLTQLDPVIKIGTEVVGVKNIKKTYVSFL